MDSPALTKARLISSVVALAWVGTLAFGVRWIKASATGQLDPGEGTSMTTLWLLFGGAVVIALMGLIFSVRGWMGRSSIIAQMGSCLCSILALWAISGG